MADDGNQTAGGGLFCTMAWNGWMQWIFLRKEVQHKKQQLQVQPCMPDEATCLSDLAMRSKAQWDYSNQYFAVCREMLRYDAAQNTDSAFFLAVARIGPTLAGFHALK